MQFPLFAFVFVGYLVNVIAGECEDPPDIMNADWTILDSNGQSARYTCRPGFSPLGINYISCLQIKWSPIGFYCQVKDTCPALRLPDNAEWSLLDGDSGIRYVGEEVQFSCLPGYKIHGNKIRTCMAGGEWSGNETTCEVEQLCPSLILPENTEWSLPGNMSGEFHVGQVVYFKCLDGYQLQGNESRTCMSGGKWSGSQTVCEKVGCVAPTVEENIWLDFQNGYAYGDVINFQCKLGSHMIGSPHSECLQNGSWSHPPPECIAVICGDPGYPQNGRRIGLLYSFGAKVTFECYPGFVINGASTTYCQADGEWTRPPPSCTERLCPILEPPANGKVFPSMARKAGTLVKFTCNPPYMLIGENSATCMSNGMWSIQVPTCQFPDCGEPVNITENGVKYSPLGRTKYGSVIEFSCRWDLDTLEGSETAYCEANGRWTHQTPICRKPCDHDHFAHAIWQGVEVPHTEHNHQAVFSCENGYTAPLGKYVTCRDGIWEPEPWCPKKKPWWCPLYPDDAECTVY